MDRTETLQILSVLKAAYPDFYRNMERRDAEAVVGLWSDMFLDDPVEIVAAAVKALIASDEKQYRPPHIGAVKAYVRKIAHPEEMTEVEAWGLVRKATANGYYGAKEEFEKLPHILQRLVGSPNQLKEWAMMDSNEFQTVVASNFQRSYRAATESEREYQAIPVDVRSIAEILSGKLALNAPAAQEQKKKPPTRHGKNKADNGENEG